MWQKIKPYFVSVAIALAVGGLSAFLTKDNMDLYSRIQTPPLSPPSIVFPIVWTVLYALMGISAASVFQNRQIDRDAANNGLITYGMSLAVNFFWSIIFFNAKAYLFAFVWLVCLLFLILRTILLYQKISPFAAYLQVPYAVWVTFAGYLNLFIAFLN